MSLGKDLAYIRKELGLSLEEIQSSIKIPLLTLQSIENDSIFDSTEHNKIYIRSFIRSYARALKLNDDDIVRALDDVEAGIYENDLIANDEQRKADVVADQLHSTDETVFKLSDVAPPAIEHAQVKEKPDIESVNWADLGKSFSLKETGSRNWALLVIVIFVIALAITGFYFRAEIIGFFDFSDPLTTEAVENNFPAIQPETTDEEQIQDSVTQLPLAPPSIPQQGTTSTTSQTPIDLENVLTAAVYAAFDKLEPVRVTSDLNGRTNPFWMEQGEAFLFDFNDTLRVRGQYSRLLLLFNGHVIDDPTQYYDPQFDAVILTREIFEDQQYLVPAPSDFPYEIGAPDSLVYRVGF